LLARVCNAFRYNSPTGTRPDRTATEYFTCRHRLHSTACLPAAVTVKYNVAYAATVFLKEMIFCKFGGINSVLLMSRNGWIKVLMFASVVRKFFILFGLII